MIKSTYTKTRKSYKVTFEVSSEDVGAKRDVRVLGDFNDWTWDEGVQLKESKGKYSASTYLPAGEYLFRYLADGSDWSNDEEAHFYRANEMGTTDCGLTLEAPEETKKAPAKKSPAKKTGSKKSDTDKLEQSTATKKPAAKAKSGKAATKKASTKKAAKMDDLKRIEGIGPKISGLLRDAGIDSFERLGNATKKELADVLQQAGARFRLAQPDTWTEQAKLAAAGKNDELKELQDKLSGGVRK